MSIIVVLYVLVGVCAFCIAFMAIALLLQCRMDRSVTADDSSGQNSI